MANKTKMQQNYRADYFKGRNKNKRSTFNTTPYHISESQKNYIKLLLSCIEDLGDSGLLFSANEAAKGYENFSSFKASDLIGKLNRMVRKYNGGEALRFRYTYCIKNPKTGEYRDYVTENYGGHPKGWELIGMKSREFIGGKTE